jgi:hypothetical protein
MAWARRPQSPGPHRRQRSCYRGVFCALGETARLLGAAPEFLQEKVREVRVQHRLGSHQRHSQACEQRSAA